MDSLVTVSNLTKKFGDVVAVEDVSFTAGSGEVFGLLGPNGAGKTTTIRLIATILAPTSGTAVVEGADITRNPQEVRRKVGVLTTDIGVYERFSGRENLAYFARLYGLADAAAARRIADLARLLEMEDFLDRRAGQYSTGMRQKLAIARSVIHDPPVIIFDEPTSGLDVLASQTVMRFMRDVRAAGRCVIFSTHQMSDAERLCDRVAIMHQGRLISLDTISNLKTQTATANLEDAFLALVKA